MLKGADRSRILLALVLLAFITGMGRLLVLRFDAGDTYPISSSLRSDPLGTKILYESLGALNGISVSRNYRTLSSLGRQSGTTLFYFGASHALFSLDAQEARALEAVPAEGNRLAILFRPETAGRAPEQKEDEEVGKASGEKGVGGSDHAGGPIRGERTSEAPSQEAKEIAEEPKIRLEKRWHFEAVREAVPETPSSSRKPTALLGAMEPGLPASLSWHSPLSFDRLGGEWKTIYAREGHPVLIERAFGRGTIVLASDSFFVSNEALRVERHPTLLAWLVGHSRSVIFEESHLGIEEDPGIAALGLKYHLEGLFAAFLLPALLFVWKNATSLLPPHAGGNVERSGLSAGKDSLSGYAGLLGRAIPLSEVLPACIEEWEKIFEPRSKHTDQARRQIRSISEEEGRKPIMERNPIQAYNRISKLLSEGKRDL